MNSPSLSALVDPDIKRNHSPRNTLNQYTIDIFHEITETLYNFFVGNLLSIQHIAREEVKSDKCLEIDVFFLWGDFPPKAPL